MTELSYIAMKKQLWKVFGDLSLSVSSNKTSSSVVGDSSRQIREEMAFETIVEEEDHQVHYGNWRDN